MVNSKLVVGNYNVKIVHKNKNATLRMISTHIVRNQTVKLGQRIDISIKTIDKPSSRVGLKLPRNK